MIIMEVWRELDDEIKMDLCLPFLVRVNKCIALKCDRIGCLFIYEL